MNNDSCSKNSTSQTEGKESKQGDISGSFTRLEIRYIVKLGI